MIDAIGNPQLKSLTPTAAEEEGETVEKIREAAQMFEQMLVKQLYAEMQKSTNAMGDGPGMAGEFYQDMFVNSMAEMSSRQGGMGIAEVLEKSWIDLHSQAREVAGNLDKTLGQKKVKAISEGDDAPGNRHQLVSVDT